MPSYRNVRRSRHIPFLKIKEVPGTYRARISSEESNMEGRIFVELWNSPPSLQDQNQVHSTEEEQETGHMDAEVQDPLQYPANVQWLPAHMKHLLEMDKNIAQVRYIKEHVLGPNKKLG